MSYEVVDALPSDGKEMLEIIESKSSEGTFELLYTKRPDAYTSLKNESKNVHIGVIKDKNGKIAGQFACIIREYYVSNKKCKVGYVCNVRKRADYFGMLNWKKMSQYVKETNCDLYLCSFLNTNDKSLSLFTKKKRSCFPELFKLTNYTTYIINPKVIKKEQNPYVFRKITKDDLQEVCDFLNVEGRKYNFAPVVTNLLEEYPDLNLSDCYVLINNKKIIAFGSLWNQSRYKQYIVKKYCLYLKILQKLSIVSEIIGFTPIPKEGEVLNFPILSFFYAENNNEQYYRIFLSEISKEIAKKYKIFVIGISEDNPNNEIINKIKHLSFQSKIYFVKYDRHIDIDKSIPINVECGFL